MDRMEISARTMQKQIAELVRTTARYAKLHDAFLDQYPHIRDRRPPDWPDHDENSVWCIARSIAICHPTPEAQRAATMLAFVFQTIVEEIEVDNEVRHARKAESQNPDQPSV